jgi:hypothetical protein
LEQLPQLGSTVPACRHFHPHRGGVQLLHDQVRIHTPIQQPLNLIEKLSTLQRFLTRHAVTPFRSVQ